MSMDLAVLMCGHYDDPGDESPSDTIKLYVILCVVAALCVILFIATQVIHVPDEDEDNKKYETHMKYLGLVYISIAAYRCFFPTQLMGWFVWWNFPLSSLLLSRLLTMVGEMAFVGMIAYSTQMIEKQRAKANVFAFGGAESGWPMYTKVVTYGLLGCAGIAQLFSWEGLVYQNNLHFFIADCCWLVGFILALPTFFHTLILASKLRTDARESLFDKNRRWYDAELYGIVISIFAVALCVELLFYDLPKFWWRYRVQVMQDNLLLNNFFAGFRESYSYQDPQRWDEIFSHNLFTCAMCYYGTQMLIACLLSQGPQLHMYRRFDNVASFDKEPAHESGCVVS